MRRDVIDAVDLSGLGIGRHPWEICTRIETVATLYLQCRFRPFIINTCLNTLISAS